MIGSPPEKPSSDITECTAAHGRYRLERMLGEGGVAIVHEAVELASGRRVALKRLRTQVPELCQSKIIALFEREFLALTELTHPRIVAAYDYGVDQQGPYYTMELLDGGDLRTLAPAEYRTACALARDVCSALSLVHSRRMVYRDLSPNNVRRTTDGLAKLIDFGALAPMGPSRELVGTLPCVAPEVLNRQPLDARTDLYALGATLYFTLVRRHAYPARDVDELRQLWQQRPRLPSELVPGIPAALDQLVMDLLQHDPALRPSNAGEVMERLTAIAGLAQDEHLLVEQAYLTTLTLVDRASQLEAIRAHTAGAKQGRGASLLITGPSGVGRSRLLDASALEAKLAGMLVLRADAQDAEAGDYGVLRAFTRGLLTQAPQLAHACARDQFTLLGSVLPELVGKNREVARELSEGAHDHGRQLQAALRQWLCEIAAQRPLFLAVDDLEHIDAPSASFLALLAREVAPHAILIVATRASDRHSTPAVRNAVHVLSRASTSIRLTSLTIAPTEQLLSSLFGDVPNLAVTAHHIYRVTRGNPRAIVLLARHLVSEGIAKYRAGAWSLPHRLSATDLPASMADALRLQVEKLSVEARFICYALSCEPSWSFRLDECAELAGGLPKLRLMQCADELHASELVQGATDQLRISQGALAASFARALDADQRANVHRRLSAVCERRADPLRAARHSFRSGDEERALELLIAHAIAAVQQARLNPGAFQEGLQALPDGWLHTYEEALSACVRRRRPARDKHALLNRVSGLVGLAGMEVCGIGSLQSLLEMLRHGAGLDLFAALPSTLDHGTRLKTAIGQAGARYQALPAEDRVLDPSAAIKELGNATVTAIGTIAMTSDYAAWLELPSIAPLVPLSPTLAVIHQLVKAVGLRLGGRLDAAIAVYRALLERLGQPDGAGLDVSRRLHMRARVMGAVGAIEASMGRASSLDDAQQLAEAPRYETTALLIRELYALFQGDLREAKQLKQRLELLRLESDARHGQEAHLLFVELSAYALANDLTGVKRTLDALLPYAPLHASFLPAIHYGRGEHHRIRGDHTAALIELEKAVASMAPGEHLLWANAAGAHIRTLSELGRDTEACAAGAHYLEAAKELGFVKNYVSVALSLALSKAGEHRRAAELADAALAHLQQLGASGLNMAVACGARAQIASAAGDDEALTRYAALYAAQWPAGSGRTWNTHTRPHAAAPSPPLERGADDDSEAVSQLKSMLQTCYTTLDIARCGLEILGRRSGAPAGALFTCQANGLAEAATFGADASDAALICWATEYFRRETAEQSTDDLDDDDQEHDDSQSPALDRHAKAPPHTPILLAHNDERGFALTGIVILVGEAASNISYPARLAAELSRSISEMEDVVVLHR